MPEAPAFRETIRGPSELGLSVFPPKLASRKTLWLLFGLEHHLHGKHAPIFRNKKRKKQTSDGRCPVACSEPRESGLESFYSKNGAASQTSPKESVCSFDPAPVPTNIPPTAIVPPPPTAPSALFAFAPGGIPHRGKEAAHEHHEMHQVGPHLEARPQGHSSGMAVSEQPTALIDPGGYLGAG